MTDSHNPFDWSRGYASQRSPVFARNVVATSHPLAAQAGLRMLQRGGNAVDAAVATAAMMTIVEPCSNGLGSDAFCILWDGQRLRGLNASGPAPAAWTPEYFARKYGSDAQTPPKRGWDSVAENWACGRSSGATGCRACGPITRCLATGDERRDVGAAAPGPGTGHQAAAVHRVNHQEYGRTVCAVMGVC